MPWIIGFVALGILALLVVSYAGRPPDDPGIGGTE